MFFSSIKKINRLISKEVSNVYLKVTIEKVTYSKLRFSKFKKFFSGSIFEGFQLTQVSLSFRTSCCSLKIKRLVAKHGYFFSIILILKEIMTF